MSSLCMCEFSPGTLVSSHSPETGLGELTSVLMCTQGVPASHPLTVGIGSNGPLRPKCG